MAQLDSSGLVDLNTERPEVQQRLADYITDLLVRFSDDFSQDTPGYHSSLRNEFQQGIGFSGIRMDAAKHIQPDDIVAIFSKLKINLGGSLPPDFVVSVVATVSLGTVQKLP